MSVEQGQGGKFSFYDLSDGIDPLFTTKLQEDAQVGCLRGVFLGENVGDDVMVTWLQNSRKLDTPSFRRELYELIDELRSRTVFFLIKVRSGSCEGTIIGKFMPVFWPRKSP